MFKVIYCKNSYFVMWPLAFITLCNKDKDKDKEILFQVFKTHRKNM